MAYTIISLEDIYKALHDDNKVKNILKDFECELNKDVEYFIHDKAIEFLKMGISKTFLVTTSYKSKNVIVGYFSLANKIVKIKKSKISKNKQKSIRRFATFEDDKTYEVSVPLIGQLGKNYKNGYNKLISGDDLLRFACDKIREAQKNLGGKYAYIECEDKEILRDFYERNGFVCFDKRNLEKDEVENNGKYLLQMICDITKE